MKRIQRKRTKGWRMPEGAIYVGRPSLWGNPWTVRDLADPAWHIEPGDRAAAAVRFYRRELEHWGLMSDRSYVVSDKRWEAEFQHWKALAPDAENMAELAAVVLRGHDLVCWCPLDQPCHADVLLELANAAPAPQPKGVEK